MTNENEPKLSANEKQVGGEHYKAKVQHWDICLLYDIPYIIGCATKYLVRYPAKNGMEDVAKAYHYLEKWCEHEYTKIPFNAIRREYSTNPVRLNEDLQAFAEGIHPDVDPRIREMLLDILYNWYGMDSKLVDYSNLLQEILRENNYKA